MAIGTETYKGLAVPLNGESEIRQTTVGNDVLTLTRKSGGTADMIVIRDADGTENAAITKRGHLWQKVITTAPTTGLVKGEMLVVWSGDFPSLGMCISTAAQTVKYITAFNNTTAGRITV